MASLTQQLQKCLLTRTDINYLSAKPNTRKHIFVRQKSRSSLNCSAIAIEAPSSLTGVGGIRWGVTKLQGARDEMEDDALVIQSDAFSGFSFAAVFDGHAGFSTVNFLRDELYKECVAALQGGLLLSGKDFEAIKRAIIGAFESVDSKLLNFLESKGGEDESGATATVMFIGSDRLYIAHVGDSSVVLSRSGKAEVLTDPHRPYGNNKASLQEIKRVREAGGWISNGRICGDIAVSRAFGDIRFKTKKNEMLQRGVKEGRWTEKFVSRVKFNGDLVVARPDFFQIALASDAEFVLLASDGLWDYVNSSEAVSIVRNQLRQHGNVQQACESLANIALDRRSQDNISIIIADFGKTNWQRLPVERENVLYEFGQAFATVSAVSLGLWLSSQLVF
ncbi:protein phosphatase 2C 57-like [Silene latifolia]|uniref:protein phosphatase 2C 57-like n=1 Tax=Silene latifolia TaxID=37657 RepID=UPI003D784156